MSLHERIAAAVARARRAVEHESMKPAYRALFEAMCDHADKVLARHPSDGTGACRYCSCRGVPCPEVRDLADLWLGPGWEQQD